MFTKISSQSQKQIELPFISDNGFEGKAYLETSFYFEDNYKVDLSLQQLQITGYTTSIGYFSGNDLETQGVTFPIDCPDCSFTLAGDVETLFYDKETPVSIPVKTSHLIEANSIMTLTIPFEIPDTATKYNQYIDDWANTGHLINTKINALDGSIFKELVNTVRLMAKANADKEKLLELITELSVLDRDARLKKLYQSRSHFYNKSAIDSLIEVVRTKKNVNPTSYTQVPTKPMVKEEVRPKFKKQPEPAAEIIVAKTTKPEEELKPISDSSIMNTALVIPVSSSETIEKNSIDIAENNTVQEVSTALTELTANDKLTNTSEQTDLSQIIDEAPATDLAEITSIEPEEQKEASSKNKKKKRKKSKKVSKISNYDFDFSTDVSKYKRSSLHTIMLRNPGAEQAEVIEETFLNRPLPEKFNIHHIPTNFISVSRKARRQDKVISEYLQRNKIAKDLVANWFNRNEKGEFNMDLIAERGHYNASVFDLNIARKSERGLAMLADAGEQLIANTFIIVNDYKYTNKEEVAKKAGFLTNLVSIAATAAGAGDVAMIADAATITTGVVGKGYVVKVTSYLYRLKWDEKIANTFYENYWIDANNFDPQKKTSFDHTDLFELELMGYETDFSGVQSSAFTSKSDAELIERATVKATDQTIAKLQRKFEIFRTKTPLISTEPLAAKIGMKEGLEKGDKFEVLEQYLEDDGTIAFNRVGVIKVDKKQIWDNRFKASEENNSSLEYSSFTGGKNKFYQGMLIRQIK
ncbi:MAG: hypothetical protein AB8B59_03105 [Maribacter sp.]